MLKHVTWFIGTYAENTCLVSMHSPLHKGMLVQMLFPPSFCSVSSSFCIQLKADLLATREKSFEFSVILEAGMVLVKLCCILTLKSSNLHKKSWHFWLVNLGHPIPKLKWMIFLIGSSAWLSEIFQKLHSTVLFHVMCNYWLILLV